MKIVLRLLMSRMIRFVVFMILKLCTVAKCISDLLIIRFDLHHFTMYPLKCHYVKKYTKASVINPVAVRTSLDDLYSLILAQIPSRINLFTIHAFTIHA